MRRLLLAGWFPQQRGHPPIAQCSQVLPQEPATRLVVDGNPSGGRLRTGVGVHQTNAASLDDHDRGLVLGKSEGYQGVGVGMPNRCHVRVIAAERQWHQHDADVLLFDYFAQSSQELDRVRVGERVRQLLGQQHTDRLRSATTECPSSGIGPGIAELVRLAKNLGSLGRQLIGRL